jgi:molybdopterin synthase sulfur carrier subunit
MRVVLPSPLYSYTGGQAEVHGAGETLAQLLEILETRYPGLRFRIIDEQDQIRTHIRFFVNGEAAVNLAHPLRDSDEVIIVAALSGGM